MMIALLMAASLCTVSVPVIAQETAGTQEAAQTEETAESQETAVAVSYTHLTLPTNSLV